jgi:hypothetical protein
MWPVLTALISPITNLLAKRSDNKTAVKQKQLDRVMSSDDKLAEWESIQAESGKHSWKDEFWTIILAIPAVMCFFPEYVGDVKAGFVALKTMPDFYQYWLGVAILTAFGIRIVKR